MNRVFLYDFDDSFTLNIYSELLKLFKKTEIMVITKDNIPNHITEILKIRHKSVLILGPGPGHPDEYPQVLNYLPDLMKKKTLYIMGICLGHQLIWRRLGARVSPSKTPKHGQVDKIILNKDFSEFFEGKEYIEVQRYNSLCVFLDKKQIDPEYSTFYSDQEELIMGHGHHFITYQFHPESIGTSCPELFFRPLQKFLL